MNEGFPEMPPRFDPANDPEPYPDMIRMEFEGELKEAFIKSSRSFRAYLQKVYQFDINTRERLEFIV